jgi:hypothetical protein
MPVADLASDPALALDLALLLERAGIRPDPWQAAMLRSDAPRQWLNWHRQSGKSTTVAAKDLHAALGEAETLATGRIPPEALARGAVTLGRDSKGPRPLWPGPASAL